MSILRMILLLSLLVPSLAFGDDNREYRIQMLWFPQAEFAGFYMAREEGLYEKAGIRVVLNHSRVDEEIFDTLRDDKADLVVGWPMKALERAAAGEDVVNVGQMAQDSSLMLIARKCSGIETPKDISGHRIGLWPAESLRTPVFAFLKSHGVTDYKIMPVLLNVDLFLYQGVDVTVGAYYDEYYRIFGAGIDSDELVCFPLQDTLKELVDDGLYCKRTTFEKNPDACRHIREATLEGWRIALADHERTLKVIKRECERNGIHFNIAHQRWMLNVMGKLIFPPTETNDGTMKKVTFDQLVQLMNLQGKITYDRFVPGQEGQRP